MAKIKNRTSCKGLNRREILKCGVYSSVAAGLSSALWLCGCRQQKRRKRKPNVLVIILDTARADRFSFLGYQHKTSPYLDILASEGAIYSSAYAPAFWTLPSHASLFTGLYPSQAGATSETNHLPAFNTTLAEILKKAGYSTAAFICNAWVSKERGFGQGFDEFYEMWRPANFSQIPKRPGRPEWATLEKVLPWLNQHKASPKPFFLFINLNSAHMPYNPPHPFQANFIKAEYNTEEISRLIKVKGMWAYLAGELKLGERDLCIMGDLYDGEIAFADYCVGKITDSLRTLAILDDTVVIVTSDHGENLGEHGLIDHLLSMYETTLRIPLVIRYPECLQAGTNFNKLVSLVDIVPTILDLCSIHNDVGALQPTAASLVSDNQPPRTFVVAENERPVNGISLMKTRFPAFDTGTIDYRIRAIRTDFYKFIWSIGKGEELYDLQTDPAELHNLAEEHTEISDKLYSMLTKWMEQNPSARDTSFLEGQDPENLRILRSLGYLK